MKIKVPPLPPSTEDLLIADPGHVAWVSAVELGYPAGAKVALIGQEPATLGQTMYLQLPKGYQLPMHWHTHPTHLVMTAGQGTLVVAGKPHPLVAGSYASLPSKVQHALGCESADGCTFVVRRTGPDDVHFVKPAK